MKGDAIDDLNNTDEELAMLELLDAMRKAIMCSDCASRFAEHLNALPDRPQLFSLMRCPQAQRQHFTDEVVARIKG